MDRAISHWLALGLVMAFVPLMASAEEALSASALSGVATSGYFDLYFSGNFNRPSATPVTPNPANGGLPTVPGASFPNGSYRNFDLYHNEFGFNDAEVSFAKKGKEVGFKLDLDFGEIPELISTSSSGTVDEVSKHVGQAVLSYSPAGSNVTINAGKMYAHLGLETVKARENWNYSRSAIFAIGTPYWHTGVNVAYAWVPGKVSTGLYLYNGWNTIYDNNAGKDLGFQLAVTPSESLSAYYNVITGPEVSMDNSDYRTVHEVNATYSLTSSLSVAGDVIMGYSTNDTLASAVAGSARWEAVELLAKYAVHPKLYLSPRYEYYWDHQGLTSGIPQSFQDVTLTAGYTVGEGLETRAEGRWDHSSQNAYLSSTGVTNNQVTLTLGLLYSM